MPHYIDGFVFPISRSRVDEYKRVAEAVAEIYREHGAIDYLEFVGDALNREGTRQFPDLIAATDDETVVFGWIVFDSRESRDLVNERVEADPRMADLVTPLLDPSNPVFEPKRMAYGGFKPLILSSAANAG
jgi:uncharacterized protein YbaA (DUF1428 family)